MTDAEFKNAFLKLYEDVSATIEMETALAGKGPIKPPKARGRKRRDKDCAAVDSPPKARCATQHTRVVLEKCREERKRARTLHKPVDTSDEALSKMAQFTDRFNLKPYEKFLHYVPRLVNVCVTDSTQCGACFTRGQSR